MAKQLNLIRIVGARPQFMQAAALRRELDRRGHLEVLVHTGQHYDDSMSRVFFDELGLPPADVNLGIGSGTHGQQTGRMLEGIEACISKRSGDAVVVDGDTNSTLAGALTAAKLNIPLVHIEAGVRCGDRSQPEEINRVVTDHTADLLCAPTTSGLAHLHREGLGDRAVLTGDLLYDCFKTFQRRVAPDALQKFGVQAGRYLLATVHRADNTDDAIRRDGILRALAAMPLPVLFPVHPRTQPRIDEYRDGGGDVGSMRFLPPLGYLDILGLIGSAKCILTDSGGVEREAAFSGVPVVVLRDSTCWTEQIDVGWSQLGGSEAEQIQRSFEHIVSLSNRCSPRDVGAVYGKGEAAERIVTEIEAFLA